jgi:hypothetical protein
VVTGSNGGIGYCRPPGNRLIGAGLGLQASSAEVGRGMIGGSIGTTSGCDAHEMTVRTGRKLNKTLFITHHRLEARHRDQRRHGVMVVNDGG